MVAVRSLQAVGRVIRIFAGMRMGDRPWCVSFMV